MMVQYTETNKNEMWKKEEGEIGRGGRKNQ